ncbi:MAG: hypothetical protein LUG16_07980 [Candidatus Gastranaerophilales bacterium]|nr:hypothetical protein [Candidatus Gastranaerophilales bacterium]
MTFKQLENNDFDENALDCKNSRIVSAKGVFSCPFSVTTLGQEADIQ